MVLSRYLVGLFLLVLLVLSLLLPRPSSAGPPVQQDNGVDQASTPRPTGDDAAVDWANVELREERNSYLPEAGTPTPPDTPGAPGESRPEPGDTAPSPPEGETPRAAEPGTPGAISPEGGAHYVVKRGDTVYDIAGRYGLTVAVLAAANNLADPSVIFPGEVLLIPDESGSVAQAETAAAVTAAPAAAATPDVPGEGNSYTVRSGDNPYRIARRFGVPVQTLIEINHITNPTRLKVGQVLIIPGPDATAPLAPEPQATLPATEAADGAYVVRPGDTLYGIARRLGMTTAALAGVNDLPDPRRLDVGQVLVIPNPESESAATPLPPSPTATAPPPTPTVEETPAPQDTGFIWPVEGGTISQYFRYGHGAIDILLPVGTPIVAAADGVIEFSGWNNYGYGWLTIIDHGNGFRTLYAHQSELLVETDQEVRQGQLIGKSGHTGWSTHPHLHFEIILNHVLKDPCAYLPGGC